MDKKPCAIPWCVALALPGKNVCACHDLYPEARPRPPVDRLPVSDKLPLDKN